MYKAYQVILQDHAVLAKAPQIREIKENFRRVAVGNFVDADGVLNGTEIIDEWFPEGDFDIFISHSHADEKMALALSHYLKEQMGLTCFIDSVVWGYSDTALRELDDKYCIKLGSSGGKAYCYDRRNVTTTHVHNMLSVSLARMMDRCECILFLNSDNSLESKATIADSAGDRTNSPWLYSEINLCGILQRNVPSRHLVKGEAGIEVLEARTAAHLPKIRYDVDIEHMTRLKLDDILKWAGSVRRKGPSSLDWLYEEHPA